MSILVGLAQHTPPEARGDPGATYCLTPQEKREFVDGLDSGAIRKKKCVREHAGGENYVPSRETNEHFKFAEDKVMGHVTEGFLDENDNLYLISNLDHTHPDTDYIHKVLDKHDSKSRIGYSMSMDVARRGERGPIVEKDVGHLGITENPLYHDDGRTRIFYRCGGQRDLDNWMRETLLDKPGFYLPKNMQRRLRDPMNIRRHTTGASEGIPPASESNLVTRLTVQEQALAATAPVPFSETIIPAHSPMAASTPDRMDTVPPGNASANPSAPAPVQGTPAAPATPAAEQQQAPPATPAPAGANAPASAAHEIDLERVQLAREYQKILDEASGFVKTPDLMDMKKKEAPERFVKAHDYFTKLGQLQYQLNKPPHALSPEESDLSFALDNVVRTMRPKFIEEIQNTDLVLDTQKPMQITAVKTKPMLALDTLVSVHANANSMSNQREAQRQLEADLAAAKSAAEAAKKEAAQERLQRESLATQLNEFNKRPRQEPYTAPLPGADAGSGGSLLKKTRTDDHAFSESSAPPGAASSAGRVKINGIELPVHRFSTGASAGPNGQASTVQVRTIYGTQEMPAPRVTYRDEFTAIKPGHASEYRLNLAVPAGISKQEQEHFSMLNEKAAMYDSLLLIHHNGGFSLSERR